MLSSNKQTSLKIEAQGQKSIIRKFHFILNATLSNEDL